MSADVRPSSELGPQAEAPAVKGIGFFGSLIVDRVLSVDGWPQEGTLGLIEGREALGTGGSAWNEAELQAELEAQQSSQWVA